MGGRSNHIQCIDLRLEEGKKGEGDGSGIQFTWSGKGQEFFFSILARDWDGTRFSSVGVGWDRSENPLSCHPLVYILLGPPDEVVHCGFQNGL